MSYNNNFRSSPSPVNEYAEQLIRNIEDIDNKAREIARKQRKVIEEALKSEEKEVIEYLEDRYIALGEWADEDDEGDEGVKEDEEGEEELLGK
ncbi:hypothetical protein INT45_007035 [Circinella minor]|uniref:Uncharacterized protein n=1 Tax=Circinella minor TaxID=1195481 RepID=A0A8H7RI21_9FUNG|nr:hypothetical protein INT45_007035 [Circinella minor]